MRKIFIITALLLTSVLSASADTQHYITFRQVDGSERSLPLVGLNITFHDGQMEATCNQESFVWDLVSTQSMRFAAEAASGVEQVVSGNQQSVAISYDLFGRRLMSTEGQPAGIYIIKDGEGARKEIKRW